MECDNWIQLGPRLEKKVIQTGTKGKRPKFWDEVDIKVDDSQSMDGERRVRIGLAFDECSRTVQKALQLMDEYEVSQFRYQVLDGSEYSEKTFRLHLVRMVTNMPPLDAWSSEDLLRVTAELKEQGIVLYRDNKIIDSFHLFSRALKLILPLEVRIDRQLAGGRTAEEGDSHCKAQLSTLIVALYSNLAACQLGSARHEETLYLCSQALERNPTDIKALYRKASALNGNGLRIFVDCH